MGKFIKETMLAAVMAVAVGSSAFGQENVCYYQAAVDNDAVWVATSAPDFVTF